MQLQLLQLEVLVVDLVELCAADAELVLQACCSCITGGISVVLLVQVQ